MKIYLASSSLRRIEYLKNWGFDFEVVKSKVEEKILDNN
ncbi:MAG: Maf family protein, partial [Fervidobacterium sp.]